MHLLVVKTTGEIIIAKPDNPKPVWGRKESDGSFYEIVHLTEDELKAGVTAALKGAPAGDRIANGRDVTDILDHAKAVVHEPHPVVALPFAQRRTIDVVDGEPVEKLMTKSAVTINLAAASIGTTPDGHKEFDRLAIKKNWATAAILEKP